MVDASNRDAVAEAPVEANAMPLAGPDGNASDDEWCEVIVGGSLIPPLNFGIVEKDVTRSGMPNELNFPFLEGLQLRTIVYLSTEEVPDPLENFIDDQDIDIVVLAPYEDEVSAQWRPISEDVVLQAMRELLDVTKYPIHIMCTGGRHKTGAVIGCLRKMQRWFLSSIFEEYQRYATAKGRLANEQFIELFDTELVNIPSTAPPWLV